MPLSCKGVFLVLLVSTMACRGLSEPATIAADFVLDNINGRPLPTFVSPIPETPSIISATLHFDVSGRVVMTELQRDIIQGELVPQRAEVDHHGTQADGEIHPSRVHGPGPGTADDGPGGSRRRDPGPRGWQQPLREIRPCVFSTHSATSPATPS